MKILLTISLLISVASAQDTLYFRTVPGDPGVKTYDIQKSTNNSTWTLFTTVQPKKNVGINVYRVSVQTGLYYRIIPNMVAGGNYTTDPRYPPSLIVNPASSKINQIIISIFTP